MAQQGEHKLRLGGESFLIRIQYQENTSWQGTIHWLEEKKAHTFRSLLELLVLIQEALAKDSLPNTGFHSWQDREGEVPGPGGREGQGDQREELA